MPEKKITHHKKIPLSDNLKNTLSPRKKLIAQNFADAKDYYQHASVQKKICQLLLSRLNTNKFNKVLEIGAGQGQLSQLLVDNITANQWCINELSHQQKNRLQNIIPNAHIYIGDAETMDLGQGYDLIISANSIQWFDNPLDIISQSQNRLLKKGQLLFNTFTENNFNQIKKLTGQGLVYPNIEQWQQRLTQCKMQVLEISTHRYDLYFNHPYEVLKHIKKTGVSTNYVNSNHIQEKSQIDKSTFLWTKSKLKQFEENYWQQFSIEQEYNKKMVYLTYEVLLIYAVK